MLGCCAMRHKVPDHIVGSVIYTTASCSACGLCLCCPSTLPIRASHCVLQALWIRGTLHGSCAERSESAFVVCERLCARLFYLYVAPYIDRCPLSRHSGHRKTIQRRSYWLVVLRPWHVCPHHTLLSSRLCAELVAVRQLSA